MKPNDLIKFFGTRSAIAEFFNVSEVAVSKWFKEELIPEGRQYEAQVRTAGALIACHCNLNHSTDMQECKKVGAG